MIPLSKYGIPVKKVTPEEPSRVGKLLQDTLPRFKDKLVHKGKQLFAVPTGLSGILMMPNTQTFMLE